jgi:hypothetical protein
MKRTWAQLLFSFGFAGCCIATCAFAAASAQKTDAAMAGLIERMPASQTTPVSVQNLSVIDASDTVAVHDQTSTSGTGKIIKPKVVNEPPVIGVNPVTFQRERNSTWKIRVSALLTAAQVTDPDDDPLTICGISSPTTNGGTVVLNGTFIYYTPPATNGNVTDSFTYTVCDIFDEGVEGMVVLTVPALPPAGATISAQPTNGVVHVQFSGIPGQLYAVQRATNMIEPVYWVTLTNIVADAYGRFEYYDTNPPPGAAFYRAAVP